MSRRGRDTSRPFRFAAYALVAFVFTLALAASLNR